jgi:hypothetical protein
LWWKDALNRLQSVFNLETGSGRTMHKQDELFGKFERMLHAANKELADAASERSRVLLGGALVDQCVTQTLRSFLAECKETEGLLDPLSSGALSGFAAKVNLCVALGILPQGDAQVCRKSAKIRNHFAHEIEASFSPKHELLVEEMTSHYSLPHLGSLTLGGRYQAACSAAAVSIVVRWSEDRLGQQRVLHP